MFPLNILEDCFLFFCPLMFLPELLPPTPPPLLHHHSTVCWRRASVNASRLFYFSFCSFNPPLPPGQEGHPHLDPQRRDSATSTRLWGGFGPATSTKCFSEVKLSSAPCWTSFAFVLLSSSSSLFCLQSLLATPSLRAPFCHVPETKEEKFSL